MDERSKCHRFVAEGDFYKQMYMIWHDDETPDWFDGIPLFVEICDDIGKGVCDG